MSFFDSVLKCLGFEVEEKPKKEKKVKEKKIKTTAEFDLSGDLEKFQKELNDSFYQDDSTYENEDDYAIDFEQQIQKDENHETAQHKNLESQMESFVVKNGGVTKKTISVRPISQAQVQAVVDELRLGMDAVVNLSAFTPQDKIRALDFISGATYCLEMKINKIDDDTYSLSH